jgi:hypothetical protein
MKANTQKLKHKSNVDAKSTACVKLHVSIVHISEVHTNIGALKILILNNTNMANLLPFDVTTLVTLM